MVDADDLNCWLLEINSSPSMSTDSPVTDSLVKNLMDDILKVVIDYNGKSKSS